MTQTTFDCDCGRQQSAHIGEASAVLVGWKFDEKGAHCPFCAGNEDKLKGSFDAN